MKTDGSAAHGPDDGASEEHLLAMAFRALVANDGFDEILRAIAETARLGAGCESVVIAATSGGPRAGPWASTGAAPPAGETFPASLVMPVLSNGQPAQLMSFYKSGGDHRFSLGEIEHARRLARLAGLVLSGASLGDAVARLAGLDEETGVSLRRGFELELAAALEAHDGRAGLVVVRVVDLEQVNSRLGREVGDDVLRLVARATLRAVGAEGSVGRLRRHEFGGCLPGADRGRTAAIAETISAGLSNPLEVLGRGDVRAAIAIGHATAHDGGPSSVTPLLHAAYASLEAASRGSGEPRASRWGAW
jgi:diguanylate cyclase (GGDEF)-like protein